MTQEVVFQSEKDGKWYFWDEKTGLFAAFDTKEIAEEECSRYAQMLETNNY